jgi:hypothetical protein
MNDSVYSVYIGHDSQKVKETSISKSINLDLGQSILLQRFVKKKLFLLLLFGWN